MFWLSKHKTTPTTQMCGISAVMRGPATHQYHHHCLTHEYQLQHETDDETDHVTSACPTYPTQTEGERERERKREQERRKQLESDPV